MVNAGACEGCRKHSQSGRLSDIGNVQLPPYHPNCKCKVEIYDSNDNIIYETPEKQYIQSSKSDSSDNTPWYGNGIKELIDDPLGTIKKHGINFLEEIPLTNYLEAAFGYDLYGNKLDSDERLGKVNTAVQQGMDALLSAYMMGGINVVGGAGKDITTQLTRAQSRNTNTLNNIIENNLTDGDFSGTLADLQGKPIPKPGGGYWDHLTEMKQSYTGLKSVKVGLEGSLQNPNLTIEVRTYLQSQLDITNYYIKKIQDLFKPFGGIK